jgi:hypothetical protein
LRTPPLKLLLLPLLVYEGANDRRVVKHESDQIIVADDR